MSVAFFYGTLLLYTLHSFIDFFFVVVVLFDPLLFQKKYSFSNIQQSDLPDAVCHDSVQETVDLKGQNAFLQFWNWIYNLYDSLFLDGHQPCKTGKRFLMYWIAAMGLGRVVALITLDVQFYVLIAVFYVLETLVFEYEGYSAKTMVPNKARLMSCISFTLFVLTCVFLLWL